MSDAEISDGQLSDFEIRALYGTYCHFKEELGRRAVELLPPDPQLRQWYAECSHPDSFEHFEFLLLRMSSEQREDYIDLITTDVSPSAMEERAAAKAEKLRRLTERYRGDPEGFHRAWMEEGDGGE